MKIDAEVEAGRIEEFLRRQMDLFQRDGAILGMSGGIDSALTATLLARALGQDKILALLLPERDSSPHSKADALHELKRLGIEHKEVDITRVLSAIGIYKVLPLQFLGARQIKEAVVRRQHESYADKLGEMPFSAGLLGTRDIGTPKPLIDAGNAYARAKHRVRMVTLYYSPNSRIVW